MQAKPCVCAADELRLLAAILEEKRKTNKLLKKLIYGRRGAATSQVHTALERHCRLSHGAAGR